MNEALLSKIKQVVKREDTILFIGSGVSRWSGLPSWRGVIDELASFLEIHGFSAEIVRKEAEVNELIQAASYGIDLLTKSQFASFIRQICRINRSEPCEIHQKIINLGPTCYTTTNYDTLIEDSLRKWKSDGSSYRIVTNRQFTEAADIIQARATHFVFKPHGDVNDSDNVILSREQYRTLFGEKLHILKALETLLSSRPVIYIGFGLRDIGFLYVKDSLANIYKGGTIDHYAIMANVSEQESAYWRKNYGIHILSYLSKRDKLANSMDHSGLLVVLDKLSEPTSQKTQPLELERDFTSDDILALARYCSRITSTLSDQKVTHIPLELDLDNEWETKRSIPHDILMLKGSGVEDLLEKYSGKACLLGNPGAGKSYSMKRSCSLLAERLREKLLCDFQYADLVIPTYLVTTQAVRVRQDIHKTFTRTSHQSHMFGVYYTHYDSPI